MAAIDGPAGPPMATKSAMDGPAGPVVAGDYLRRDRSLYTVRPNSLRATLNTHAKTCQTSGYPSLDTSLFLSQHR